MLNYSTSIFTNAGLSENAAQYSTIGTTGVIVLMTLISVGFMDKIGRRILHLTGLSGCLISMVIITIALFVQVCIFLMRFFILYFVGCRKTRGPNWQASNLPPGLINYTYVLRSFSPEDSH